MQRRSGPLVPWRSMKNSGRRPDSIREQVGLRRLESFVLSPDGGTLVLQVATASRGKNRLDTSLWSVNADGTRLRRLPATSGRVSSPPFSPRRRGPLVLGGLPRGP